MAMGKNKVGGHSRASSSMAGTTEDSFGAQGNESDSDCMSTEGEESDPNSPLCPDSQYLNQSNDLRAALITSKALVGDYVELKNCKRCGSMIFKVSSVSFLPKYICEIKY